MASDVERAKGPSIKITDAQVEVLRLLATGPKQTGKCTHHGLVSGVCAEALIRRGLARAVHRPFHDRATGWHDDSPYEVAITLEGRAAITSLSARKPR